MELRQRIWNLMGPERRLAAAQAFLENKDQKAAQTQVDALLAQRLHARPVFIRRLPPEKNYEYIPFVEADYREMIEKEKPQIVSICQRWVDRHHEMIMACVERGIHVFMEKPFCRTLVEADQIVRTCEMTHAKLAIAHQTRYCPIIPVVKRMIEEGKLGTILEMRARGKEDQRGGAEDLWVLGSHLMNLMQVFAGDPMSCFATVMNKGKPITLPYPRRHITELSTPRLATSSM